MIIVCLGYVDKRPLIYALLKLLNSFGDVALITRNTQMQRLLENKNTSGHFNNVFVSITDSSLDNALEKCGFKRNDFDHIIFDSIDTIPENYDLCIHSKSFSLLESESDLLGFKSDIVKFNFIYDGKAEKGSVNIPVSYQLIKSVEEFEARKMFVPIKCDALLKNIANLTTAALKIPAKDAIKILKRK